jgi:hypothetical protein
MKPYEEFGAGYSLQEEGLHAEIDRNCRNMTIVKGLAN